MRAKTFDLIKRRDKLVTDTVGAYWEAQELESKIATVAAEGGDVDKAVDAAHRARGRFDSMRTALDELDRVLFETSLRENREQRDAIRADAEKAYRQAIKAAEAGIAKTVADVAKVVPISGTDGLTRALSGAFEEQIWEAANEAYADEYTERVPPIVKLPQRNAAGEVKDPKLEPVRG